MAIPSSPNARVFYRAAQERYEDAKLLLKIERTTASTYLAGYAVECMLKALILSVTPKSNEEDMLLNFRGKQAHQFEWLLDVYQFGLATPIHREMIYHFTQVSSWTTDLRYSPKAIAPSNAQRFLDSVAEIIKWADGRL
ncbi:MAG: HEPN domain-containing protein [Chloroflexota bacterium]